jgi:hypothetical protein
VKTEPSFARSRRFDSQRAVGRAIAREENMLLAETRLVVYQDRGFWYWRLEDIRKNPLFRPIISRKKHKLKRGAVYGGRSFAKRHKFEILQEWEM